MKFENLKAFEVGGYLPASFLDWEAHVAASVFVSGCNFRCPWCHNGSLVLSETEPLRADEVASDIARRCKFLDGVVLSGGEPTIWDGLFPFLEAVRDIGLPLKLDTNGSRPETLRKVLTLGLAEHVAMDVKAPFDGGRLAAAAGVPVRAETLRESLKIIRELAPSYELRTTWSPDILPAEGLLAIRDELEGDENWVVQLFRPTSCLDPSFEKYKAASEADVRSVLPDAKVRG